MGVSKVELGDTTLIDLTSDTVSADSLLVGATAHNAAGDKVQGLVQPVVVDDALSSTSTNPVQNKVVKGALDSKSDTNHTHNYVPNTSAGMSTAINLLGEGTSDPTDNDYYIAQYAGGGTSAKTYYRRPHKALFNYIKAKLGNMTGATASAAGKEGLVPPPAAGKQASFLRGDGTWAVPTDTWRGIQNNLTSDSTTDSLSAAQGKVLKGLVDGKAASSHTHSYLPLSGGTVTGALRVNSTIFGYNYKNSKDAPAFIFDKPGSNYTGIGCNGSADTIFLSAVNSSDLSWNTAYKQKWKFNGDVIADTFSGSLSGNASSASKLTNTSAIGSSTQPVYFSASGVPTPTTYTLGTSVPANTKHMVYYEADLSSYSNTLFYPLVWAPTDEYLDVSIQSPNLGGNAAYNQNDLHAIIRTQGWSDTPISYQILELNRYSDSEQTIMSLVRGQQTGTVGFYLRGGMKYRVIANRGYQKLCTSDYTYGTETWKAGISSVTGTIGSNIVTWLTLYDKQNGSLTNTTLFSGVVVAPKFIANTLNVSGVFSQNRTTGSTVGENSFVGNNNNTASGTSSTAFGGQTKATGGWSFAEGWNTTSSGTASHAEGWDSVASNDCAHAEGKSNTASGFAAHAEGEVSVASEKYSHAEGHFSTASGESSHSEGNNCTAKGIYSHAGGNGAIGGGYASFSQGWCTSTSSDTTIALGRHNKNTSGNLLELGYGSDSVKKNVFSITSSGYVKATGTYTASTTADYAEYFEWLDGNPNGEDRVGYFVTLEGNKIKVATQNDSYILGVVSGEPFVLGNGDCDIWNGVYLRDDFRRKVMEDAPKLEVYTFIDEETGEELTDIRESETEFEGYRPKLNPEYDSAKEYIPRSERPEWAPVGMLGVLAVRHDGTAKVNSYVTVNKDGIATACEKHVENSYRVIKSNSDTVVEIIFR